MGRHGTLRIGSSLALLLAATCPGRYTSAAEPAANVVAQHDKDNDKTLDWNEVQAAAGARFDALNKDADGTLESKEVKGVIGKSAFLSADPDKDGTLSKSEYLALVKKLFRQANLDQDGTIDAKELLSKAGHHLKLLIQ